MTGEQGTDSEKARGVSYSEAVVDLIARHREEERILRARHATERAELAREHPNYGPAREYNRRYGGLPLKLAKEETEN